MKVRCWLAAVCMTMPLQVLTARAGAPTDRFGDPLPEGAVARMGTIRFRHGGAIEMASFLPDGKTIVSVDFDTVRWWDAATGKEMRRRPVSSAMALVAVASPDRRTFAVRDFDEVVLCDAATGKERARLRAERAGIAFSPNGQLLATWGDHLVLWDTETGKRVRDLDDAAFSHFGAAFLPDGNTLVMAGKDGVLRWCDTESGKVVHEAAGPKGGGARLAASPDGRRLAMVGRDDALHLWDAVDRTELRVLRTSAAYEATFCLAFSPDGKLLAAGGGDGLIRLYDAGTGDELRCCEGHQDMVWSVAFSPDGATLVSGGADSAVRQWDVSTGKEIRPFAGPCGRVEALAVSPDGTTVASAGADSRVHLWDAVSGEERRSLNGSRGDEAVCLSFGADGRTVTAVYRDGGLVRLWDAADGKQLHSFSMTNTGSSDHFALSPDGAVVAAFGGHGNRMTLFDAAKGEMLLEYKEEDPDAWVAPGPFLGTGQTLTAYRSSAPPAARTNTILLWDVRTGARKTKPVLGDGKFGEGDWAGSPDGRTVAAPRSDGLELWDANSGELIRRWDANYGYALTAAFSADGRTMSMVDADGAVVLWETAAGQRRGTLEGVQGQVNALAFSPDGRRLYTGGDDGTVLAWDLTGRRAATPVPADLDGKALDRLWDDLADADAAQAYKTIWTLAAAPDQAVPFLKARLHQTRATPAQIAAWITDLGSDDFDVRQKASAELCRQGGAAESALTAALTARPSPEAARRIEQLLQPLDRERRSLHPSDVRLVRAVETLECIGRPAAREVLTDLADGPDTALGCEAKGSLERLQRRKP